MVNTTFVHSKDQLAARHRSAKRGAASGNQGHLEGQGTVNYVQRSHLYHKEEAGNFLCFSCERRVYYIDRNGLCRKCAGHGVKA